MGHETDLWMPLFWGDYLKDTMRLSTIEHGAYFLLMGEYWITGEPLPDDDVTLRNITKTSSYNWKKIRPVLKKFFVVEGGVWKHKRIDEELSKAAENKEKRQEKARKAAAARWENGDARSMLEECPSPPPSPSSSDDIPSTITTTVSVPSGEHGGDGCGDLNFDETINDAVRIYREAVGEIFGSGPIRTEMTSPKARQAVGAWFTKGADLPLCRVVFTSELSRMKAIGEQPPNVIWYFTDPILRVLREETRPWPGMGGEGA